MFHVRANELIIDLRFDLLDPLLVKEGGEREAAEQAAIAGAEREAQLVAFVRTKRPGELGKIYYIPGSSLRGVLRSSAERRARLFNLSGAAACDPFDASSNCGEKIAKGSPGEAVYKHSCAICRCFGNVRLKGRWGISDALPAPAEKWHDPAALKKGQDDLKRNIQDRTQTAVSRKTGSAAVGPNADGSMAGRLYRNEAIYGGSFYARLSIVNYELWQLGLLAYLLHDLNSDEGMGRIHIGYGGRRGLGRVTAHVEGIRWRFYDAASGTFRIEPANEGEMLVLKPLAGQTALSEYDLRDGGSVGEDGHEPLRVGPVVVEHEYAGLFTECSMTPNDDTALDSIWGQAAPLWAHVAESWTQAEAEAVVAGSQGEESEEDEEGEQDG